MKKKILSGYVVLSIVLSAFLAGAIVESATNFVSNTYQKIKGVK